MEVWTESMLFMLTILGNWQVVAFASTLESRKITVSVRQTRGLDASAACGQLRNDFQKSPLQAAADDNATPAHGLLQNDLQKSPVLAVSGLWALFITPQLTFFFL